MGDKINHCISVVHPLKEKQKRAHVEMKVINIRCCATATAAIRQGGPWEPESEVTLAPASLSLSEAIAKGSASKFALISSARSTHRSAAFLCAWPSAYANGRLPKLARIFEFYEKVENDYINLG